MIKRITGKPKKKRSYAKRRSSWKNITSKSKLNVRNVSKKTISRKG